ncbi:MAG: 3-phosphoserine/phosphohydroxythreonine transaminase [Oscillospiraceae bacterium]|jgi:phosphoserine aminotransferase|nr:3-phosphoserine/phosphohydroxythreonine transaminase [Oscillospiraceae bacterium]
MGYNRIFNFSAGPSMLPEKVLERAAGELLNYGGSGCSVMEMSHRSKAYDAIIVSVEEKLRQVMEIPEDYNVLFLQGGATTQFAMAPINLIGRTGKADYAVTGNFSKKAAEEAEKYGEINIAASSKDRNFAYIPQQDALKAGADASFFHYCMNNTIYGSRWNYIPENTAPLVCDMSSCILSEPVDVSKFGLIYAGAQKNMAPAGLTVVIYKKSLELCPPAWTPVMLDYAVMAKNSSMYNTPPTYCIYILGLVLDWMKELGGTKAMKEINLEKAGLLYSRLDRGGMFKTGIDKEYRSMMNVTFSTGDEELDAKFCKGAEAAGLVSIKGHRAVGGMRASIYNAMPREGITALIDYMDSFEKENRK